MVASLRSHMMLLLALLAAVPDANLLSLEAGTVAVQSPASWGGTWTPEVNSASTGPQLEPRVEGLLLP